MYEESINLLRWKAVEFDEGLKLNEIAKIEKIYDIQFPKSLKEFLMKALPISKGFYNWRNVEQNNIEFIKQMIKRPKNNVSDLVEELNWCNDWGKKPQNTMEIEKIVKERLKQAPTLLPIYAHRYMPIILDDNPPVVSIHGIDIIYYGENLEDYFKVEFGQKGQNEVEFQNITPIPFWSDIM